MAQKAKQIGAQKTRLDVLSLLVLAILAGAFIALGAMFATTVLAGTDGVRPYGVSRLLDGIVFCLGLILVIVHFPAPRPTAELNAPSSYEWIAKLTMNVPCG